MIIAKAAVCAWIAASLQYAIAKEASPAKGLRNIERAVVFAIQQEFKGKLLENRKDVCVGFGHGLDIDDKAALLELKNRGLKARRASWCNRGPRGISIALVAPIRETSPGTYEFIVEVGDLAISEGEHFATLLRRGTYVVRCEGSLEPQLVSYRQTC